MGNDPHEPGLGRLVRECEARGIFANTKADGSSLPESALTLGEVYQRAGFETATFLANGYVSDRFGFAQGWDHYTNYIRENRQSEADHVFPDAARWIIDRKVRLAGDDTATFEKRPAAYGKELFSVHMMLLADNGIYIMENANLEPLGDAKVGVALLVVTPLKIEGATGSPLRVLALA